MENNKPSIRSNELSTNNLADILERVLDKGIVIAGDIKINLAEIELLEIKIRLLITSVDRAKELGINWWETDPYLTTPPKKLLAKGNDAKRITSGRKKQKK